MFFCSKKVGLATFATYIYTEETHRFDPQTAFVAVTLFNILRFAINIAPIVFMELIQAVVSIRRLGKFLNHEDLDFTNVSHEPSGISSCMISRDCPDDLGGCYTLPFLPPLLNTPKVNKE